MSSIGLYYTTKRKNSNLKILLKRKQDGEEDVVEFSYISAQLL